MVNLLHILTLGVFLLITGNCFGQDTTLFVKLVDQETNSPITDGSIRVLSTLGEIEVEGDSIGIFKIELSNSSNDLQIQVESKEHYSNGINLTSDELEVANDTITVQLSPIITVGHGVNFDQWDTLYFFTDSTMEKSSYRIETTQKTPGLEFVFVRIDASTYKGIYPKTEEDKFCIVHSNDSITLQFGSSEKLFDIIYFSTVHRAWLEAYPFKE